MTGGRPEPGEIVWHGGKAYSSCALCYKLVQINKSFFGSMHVCLTAEEREQAKQEWERN